MVLGPLDAAPAPSKMTQRIYPTNVSPSSVGATNVPLNISPTGGDPRYAAAGAPIGAPPSGPSYTASEDITGDPQHNWDPGHTDPITGFSARAGFTPLGLSNMYQTPQVLSNAVLAAMGLGSNSGISQLLADQFGALNAQQFMLNANGANANEGNLTDSATINWIANAMQQMNTPGGRTPEADVMMQALLNSGAANHLTPQEGGGTAPDSPLGAYWISGKTPQEQAGLFNSMAIKAANGLNPYMQKATAGYLQDAASNYQGNVATGGAGSQNYGQYLANTDFSRWYR